MKRRNIVIIALVVVALLVGVWFLGGRQAAPVVSPTPTVAETATPTVTATAAPTAEPSATPEQSPSATPEQSAEPSATPEPTPEPTAPPPSPTPTKDKYQTDPVPSGKPLPVEQENVTVGDGTFTVTLSVRCNTLLVNTELLDKEKRELVPEDGVIFPATAVSVNEGESVFNVLQREMRRAKIHMEFRNTPIYNSAYIRGINNLYEFDAGNLSGWMYKVNDWFPNYGCSRYQLKPGDIVEWVYTCDLGKDVGGGYAAQGGDE